MEILTPDELLEWYRHINTDHKRLLADFVESNMKLHKVDLSKYTHKAIGKLVFQYPDKHGKDIPIHNMHVEFYDHETWSSDDFLGTTLTDETGYFEIKYDPSEFLNRGGLESNKLDPELRILETYHLYDKDGNKRKTKKVLVIWLISLYTPIQRLLIPSVARFIRICQSRKMRILYMVFLMRKNASCFVI